MSDTPNNITLFVSALVSPTTSLEAALQQLLSERSIDTAVGAQLDVIGRIVGQAREGLDDETYRRYIRARVAANFSKGRVSDLIRLTELVVYDDAATYYVRGEGTATVRLRIDGVDVTDAIGEVVFDFASDAVSAGVRIIVQWSNDYSNAFRLDVGPGLDVGELASSLG